MLLEQCNFYKNGFKQITSYDLSKTLNYYIFWTGRALWMVDPSLEINQIKNITIRIKISYIKILNLTHYNKKQVCVVIHTSQPRCEKTHLMSAIF